MFKSLKQSQLKTYISTSLKVGRIPLPAQGWIRTIREYYGMSVAMLAKRVGLVKSRVTVIEKAELERRITVETLAKFAEALNCDLVYMLVPKEDPEQFLKQHAEIKANVMIERLRKTMDLEDQGISEKEIARHKKEFIETLLKNPKSIWRES